MRNSSLVVAALCSLFPVACSGDPAGDRDESSSSKMDSSAAGAASDPFGNSTMNQDPSLFPQQDGGGTDEEQPGECGSTSVAAESVVIEEEVLVESEVTVVKPVALYIMFDKSLSMSMEWGGVDLWNPAVAAIESFVSDDASEGLSVGLQYFPIDAPDCRNGEDYDTPAVAVGELPGHAPAISASLDAENPNGQGTPIEDALLGLTRFCLQHQAANEGESCVGVLVTDGYPQYAPGCSTDDDELAAIAGDAYAEGVRTFAVGLEGADFDLLDLIAQQGGAPDCDPDSDAYACNVSTAAGGPSKLASALSSIRDTVVTTETHTETVTRIDEHRLPCEWEIPEVPEGEFFDRDKVNIKLTADGDERTFARVSSADSCVEDGWYFDDADSPARILACPQTCAMIEGLPEAKIDILLGCATIEVE